MGTVETYITSWQEEMYSNSLWYLEESRCVLRSMGMIIRVKDTVIAKFLMSYVRDKGEYKCAETQNDKH